MIIIYGHRAYGRVDEHDGEYLQTTFAHVYYLPLVPTGSMWVTRDGRDGTFGLKIPLDGKSVLAAYLRTWALVLAIVPFVVAPSLVTGVGGLALLALSLYSWTWRGLRGVLARKRGDFNLLAYGTRCEPRRIGADTRAQLTAVLEARHAKLPEQRPVEDIARFGATDLDEAVIAYGLLRLAALEHRDSAAEAAANRLVHGNHDALPAGDGPYRELKRSDEPMPAQVEQAAALQVEQVREVQRARDAARPRGGSFWSLPGMTLLVAGCLALFSAGMLAINGDMLLGSTELTAADLKSAPHIKEFVAVRCDSVDGGEWHVDSRTKEAENVFYCQLGERTLTVVAHTSTSSLASPIEGRLYRMGSEMQYDLKADASTLDVYLDTKGNQSDRGLAIGGVVGGAAALLLGAFWLVRFLRARRRS